MLESIFRAKNVATQPTQEEIQPCSSSNVQKESTTNGDGKDKPTETTTLTGSAEPGGNGSTSSIVHGQEAKPIVVDGDLMSSVACLPDGEHIVSGGGWDENIRRWRVEDGMEVGTPMYAGSAVYSVAVSNDGKWVVSGTQSGLVTVWSTERHEKVTEFKGHGKDIFAVDISPDATKIVTGSNDETACVWSLSTGERLLDPWKHDDHVVAAKFSPDGCLVATAIWKILEGGWPVFVYDVHDGHRLVKSKSIIINSTLNNSIAWMSARRFLALSRDGNIHCFDVVSRRTTQWPILPSNVSARCIALANNGRFVAVSAGPSVSFWDTTTQKQIGPVIEHTTEVQSMTISANYDLVTSAYNKISFHSLCNILPSYYVVDKNAPKVVKELRMQLAASQQACQEGDILIQSLRAQEVCSANSIARLEKIVQELGNGLTKSQRIANEQKDSLNDITKSLRSDLHTQETNTILEQSSWKLHTQLADAQCKADTLARAHKWMRQCESMCAQGRVYDAAGSLFEMARTITEDARDNKLIMDWLVDFTDKCVTMLERVGDEASNAKKLHEALAAYTAALSLSPLTPTNTMLMKWASTFLVDGSAEEALNAATKFMFQKFGVYRVICDVLERDNCLADAVKCFKEMQSELPNESGNEREQWELDFRQRCVKKLEKLGDAAKDNGKHDVAIEYYSNALSLDPKNLNDILLKRSNEIIELDPSSHRGYEGKHAALLGMGHHSEAFEAFKMMISKLEQSSDSKIRELRHQYVDATSAIREVVEETIRHMPRVLIDTATGRLYDKAEQVAAFEELPIYDELRSSMTTELDYPRTRREVKKFYRYVMLSHRWQPNEPTFQQLENTSIYELPLSPTFLKLQNFCKLVVALQFKWAWSDTCCVNQLDKGVLQESLIAMFRWYRGSSLTVVHLVGVPSESQEIGCLWKSIWNTRGWTYQEYVASEVVQFYTEDWKPYLGLDIFNHKESPVILSEMEQAMNLATHQLATLQPGLDKAREKLYLASRRQTTREEDIAYSLFGIFNVALPVLYGEENQAVGRLLEHILTRSDDVTLLAWTGSSGSHHNYLPADLTVYNKVVPPHVPRCIETAEMDGMVAGVRSSITDLSFAETLYQQLLDLPPLLLVGGRLRLPCIVFPVAHLSPLPKSDPESDFLVYRATSPILGDVEIKTKDSFSEMGGLLLIHPWISPLLDRDFSRAAPLFNLTTRALRLLVRLRQPFGALLLAPSARSQYRRVATDSLIMVRVREETSLNELAGGIRTVDIQ